MNVSIRVGAGLALGTGMSRLSVTLAEGATGADLLEYLRDQYPDATRLESAVLVSNGEQLCVFEEVSTFLPAPALGEGVIYITLTGKVVALK